MTVIVTEISRKAYHTSKDCPQLRHSKTILEVPKDSVEVHKCPVCDGKIGARHTKAHRTRNKLLDMNPDEVPS